MTSSIRTRDPEEQPDLTGDTEKSKESASSTQGDPSPPPPPEDRVKELLLCLRPIRDGGEKVDEKHRLACKRQVSDYSNTTSSGGDDNKKSDQLPSSATAGRNSHTPPLKKRKKEPANGSVPKRSRLQSNSSSAPGTEDTAVAVSLMMMSSK